MPKRGKKLKQGEKFKFRCQTQGFLCERKASTWEMRHGIGCGPKGNESRVPHLDLGDSVICWSGELGKVKSFSKTMFNLFILIQKI